MSANLFAASANPIPQRPRLTVPIQNIYLQIQTDVQNDVVSDAVRSAVSGETPLRIDQRNDLMNLSVDHHSSLVLNHFVRNGWGETLDITHLTRAITAPSTFSPRQREVFASRVFQNYLTYNPECVTLPETLWFSLYESAVEHGFGDLAGNLLDQISLTDRLVYSLNDEGNVKAVTEKPLSSSLYKKLIDKGFDANWLNVPDSHGNTLIHKLARRGDAPLVRTIANLITPGRVVLNRSFDKEELSHCLSEVGEQLLKEKGSAQFKNPNLLLGQINCVTIVQTPNESLQRYPGVQAASAELIASTPCGAADPKPSPMIPYIKRPEYAKTSAPDHPKEARTSTTVRMGRHTTASVDPSKFSQGTTSAGHAASDATTTTFNVARQNPEAVTSIGQGLLESTTADAQGIGRVSQELASTTINHPKPVFASTTFALDHAEEATSTIHTVGSNLGPATVNLYKAGSTTFQIADQGAEYLESTTARAPTLAKAVPTFDIRSAAADLAGTTTAGAAQTATAASHARAAFDSMDIRSTIADLSATTTAGATQTANAVAQVKVAFNAMPSFPPVDLSGSTTVAVKFSRDQAREALRQGAQGTTYAGTEARAAYDAMPNVPPVDLSGSTTGAVKFSRDQASEALRQGTQGTTYAGTEARAAFDVMPNFPTVDLSGSTTVAVKFSRDQAIEALRQGAQGTTYAGTGARDAFDAMPRVTTEDLSTTTAGARILRDQSGGMLKQGLQGTTSGVEDADILFESSTVNTVRFANRTGDALRLDLQETTSFVEEVDGYFDFTTAKVAQNQTEPLKQSETVLQNESHPRPTAPSQARMVLSQPQSIPTTTLEAFSESSSEPDATTPLRSGQSSENVGPKSGQTKTPSERAVVEDSALSSFLLNWEETDGQIDPHARTTPLSLIVQGGHALFQVQDPVTQETHSLGFYPSRALSELDVVLSRNLPCEIKQEGNFTRLAEERLEPRVDLLLTRSQGEEMVQFIKDANTQCRLEGRSYSLINGNCIDFIQELFQETGFSGHFGRLFLPMQLTRHLIAPKVPTLGIQYAMLKAYGVTATIAGHSIANADQALYSTTGHTTGEFVSAGLSLYITYKIAKSIYNHVKAAFFAPPCPPEIAQTLRTQVGALKRRIRDQDDVIVGYFQALDAMAVEEDQEIDLSQVREVQEAVRNLSDQWIDIQFDFEELRDDAANPITLRSREVAEATIERARELDRQFNAFIPLIHALQARLGL